MFKIFRICWKKKYFRPFHPRMEITLLKLRSLLLGMSSTNSSELTDVMFAMGLDLNCRVHLDQMSEERVKLKRSVAEANLRADLLAQEVDDHHRQLERSTQEKLMSVILIIQQQHNKNIFSKNYYCSSQKTNDHTFSSLTPMSRSLEKKHRERLNALEQELMNERELLSHQCLHLSQKLEKERLKWQENECRSKETIARLEQVLIPDIFPYFLYFILLSSSFQLFLLLRLCYNIPTGKEQNLQ